jgi:hypothetical protein
MKFRAGHEPTGLERASRHIDRDEQDVQVWSWLHRLAPHVRGERTRTKGLRVAHPCLDLHRQRAAPATSVKDEVNAFVIDQRRGHVQLCPTLDDAG